MFKKKFILMLNTILITIFVAISTCFAKQEDILSIIKNVESLLIEKDACFVVKMEIIRENKKSEYTMTIWAKERNFVSRVERPIIDKGTIFLLNKEDCWIYYPTIDKILKSSKKDRLLGSDFSFVDIANLNLLDDYNSKFVDPNLKESIQLPFDENNLNNAILNGHIIESNSIENKSPSYPKVKTYIANEGIPYRQEFYTLSGRLLGILLYKNFTNLNGKNKPETLMMTTSLNTKNYTILTYKKATYNANIPEIYFTPTYMKELSRGR